MMETCGYKTQTTFYDDFTIADRFGISAVKDTFKRAFDEWKTNTVFVTELVMVLNHKMWHHHDSNMNLAKVYHELYEYTNEWCWNNLKDDDLNYYFRITD